MDEFTLIDRLHLLHPPDTEIAKSLAREAVPARVRAARSGEVGHPRHRWSRFLVASVLVALAIVNFSAFTAPGQAVSSWVGDQLGLGQPGGPPALQSLREGWTRGTDAEGQPAYVLVRGPGPLGGHYELVTYRASVEPGRGSPIGGGPCFQLDFPEARNLFHAGCGIPAASDGLLYAGVGGNSAPGAAYQFASGRVGVDVAAVDFEVDGRAYPVELRAIPADLIDRFDIPRPFKFFFVLLNADLRDGEVTVTARNAGGDPVATQTSTLLGVSVLQP